jgi:hypothetical protein
MNMPINKDYAPALGYTAAALGMGSAGIPVSDIMFPSIYHSVLAGAFTGGGGLVHRGGFNYGGAFGYRTLFAGHINQWSKYTMGNAVLSGVEALGKYAWNKGHKNLFFAWATTARQTGLAGLLHATAYTAKDPATHVLAAQAAMKNVKFDSFGARATRFMGGTSDDVAHLFTKYAGKGQGFAIPKLNANAPFIIGKGSRLGSIIGTGFSMYSMFELASMITDPLIDYAIDKLSISAGNLRQFLMENRRASMGRGYLGPSFQNYYAATERQRAVQAIYSARVNPQSQVYGNEARYLHR